METSEFKPRYGLFVNGMMILWFLYFLFKCVMGLVNNNLLSYDVVMLVSFLVFYAVAQLIKIRSISVGKTVKIHRWLYTTSYPLEDILAYEKNRLVFKRCFYLTEEYKNTIELVNWLDKLTAEGRVALRPLTDTEKKRVSRRWVALLFDIILSVAAYVALIAFFSLKGYTPNIYDQPLYLSAGGVLALGLVLYLFIMKLPYFRIAPKE